LNPLADLADTAPDALAAPPAPSRRIAQPWPSRLLETVLAYLPVLMMGMLALATWWLVQNSPVPEAERPAEPPRHEPDYTMNDFLVQRFAADGSLRVQIEGDRLHHYPDTDTLEIENPRIRAISPEGRVTDASARRAVAKGDASEMELVGNATVVREATEREEAIEFHGEFLHAFADSERVRSHLPVVVRRGATVVRADGFEYDHARRVLEFRGRMRAVFAPPKAGAG
jgi:lipopolysaccharide export system protein LptC